MIEFELYPEDFERAAECGINAYNLRQRFNQYAWDKERAITQPLDTPRKYEDVYKKALENGLDITYRQVGKRMYSGWTKEQASTIPDGQPRKAPDPYIATAEENGINRETYKSRRHRGWTRKKASTHSLDRRFTKEE